MDVSRFTKNVVGVVVSIIIIVAVALPIIAENVVPEGTVNAGAINAIIGVIPILLIVGVILSVVGMFMSGNQGRFGE